MASWLLLAILWPVLHVASLIQPAPFPPWLTPLLERPLRRRLQNPERCVEQSGLARGMTALEVGPGAGYATEAAVRKLGGSGRLVCLDLQPDMLRRVRTRLGSDAALLVCASGSELPFREGVKNRSGERYREWAARGSDAALAAGLRECARREDAIAERLRAGFKDIICVPADLARLLEQIQGHVVALFGGHRTEEQYLIQARVERGGEQFWKELAASQTSPASKALLLECAALEAQSAAFLERLDEE